MEATVRVRSYLNGDKTYFRVAVPPWFPVKAGDLVKVSTVKQEK